MSYISLFSHNMSVEQVEQMRRESAEQTHTMIDEYHQSCMQQVEDLQRQVNHLAMEVQRLSETLTPTPVKPVDLTTSYNSVIHKTQEATSVISDLKDREISTRQIFETADKEISSKVQDLSRAINDLAQSREPTTDKLLKVDTEEDPPPFAPNPV